MTPDAHALYAELMLDHGRRPRNFRALGARARTAEGVSPLCGDRLTVYVELAGDVLRDVAFLGEGCTVATASASLMSEALRGRSPAEAVRLADALRALLDGRGADAASLGALAALAAVRAFPSRTRCALLAWQALEAALART